jgi:two-component system, LytTR family, sensor kinase
VRGASDFISGLQDGARHLRSALWVVAVSTAIGLYFAAEAHLADPAPIRKPWLGALGVNLAYYWAWGAAVPLVAVLNRRFPVSFGRRAWNLAPHLFASVLVTVASITLVLFLVCPAPSLAIVSGMIATKFYSGFPIYWLILVVLLAVEYHDRYRDRERRAARLARQLKETRLDGLRSQLNPHFLYNALNSVSSLMYTDPETADTMIQKFGELLRLSLDRDHGSEVALRDEITFVKRYVDIEGLRFGERLQIAWDVEPETLQALVPAFTLQPLVENAIHHSIAPRKGGHVEISARRDRERLHLAVIDDGPDIPPGPAEGTGLANMRARLAELYSRPDALRFVRQEDARLRVEIVLPFRSERL